MALLVLSQGASELTPDLANDFELPAGLEVRLWAETPQLHDPSAMDVDARGWVWVTEAVDGSAREGGDRVVVLRDTDLDGRCDDSRVFVQDPELVAPLGILVQVLWQETPLDGLSFGAIPRGERVFVSCSPSILVYEDKNGDGDAMDPGEKDVFLTGFGGRDPDHGVHSLVWGPDGRLFFAVGNAGPHIVTDKSGWTLRSGSVHRDGGATIADNEPGLVSDDGKVYTGGLILSVKPDGTDLRVEAHNFRNPHAVTSDNEGQLYTLDNDDEGSACRASWVLRGGNYGFFSAHGSRTWRADQRPGQSIVAARWRMDDPGVVTSGTLTGSGRSTGICFYNLGAAGEWFSGQVLGCDSGLACEGREEEVFALLSAELGGSPAQWDARFAGLAWRLHPPSAVPAFAARALEATLPLEARKQALDALAFVKTKEAAEAMAKLAVSAPEDLRPHARWWLANRATNDWRAWVDR